jgi:aspartyl-tRNA(Asn)/glutamyl-tRNA(Gln) amidotransferase subunit A
MRLASDADTLVDVVDALRRREQSATGLVEAALARIEATEPDLFAFTHVAADRARAEARQLDADAAAGRWRGPLHGVPVAVKDLFDVEGEITTAGSRLPPTGRVAANDAVVVARLRAAGAIVLGRTRTHEYAWGLTTQHPVLGGTRNPFDTARVPGGSSGGSAAAVAAGVVPLATGTDTAGSIRLPAAWCGLVGHKPTHGRVSLAGVVPLAPSFDHAGPIVRTVADARLALSVLLGIEVARGHRADDLTGLRVGVLTDDAPPVDTSVAEVLSAAVSRLTDAGAVVVQLSGPPWPRMRDTFFRLQASEALGYHRGLGHWPDQAERYGDDVRDRLRRAEGFRDEDIAAARDELAAVRREVAHLFDKVDVFVDLVAGSGPSLVTTPDQVRVDGSVADLRDQVLPHTLLASLCGLPACSVPAGYDRGGLPVGVQVIGPSGSDELVLDIAESLCRLNAVPGEA